MSIDAKVPLLSVLITPLHADARLRHGWALNEIYAGFFQKGTDGGAGDNAPPKFDSLQYKNQPAFANISGPLDFVRFTADGLVERGVPAALASSPQKELCGITATLRTEHLQNRMLREPDGVRAPKSPANAPVLEWKSEQGKAWETYIPARSPVVAGVRHTKNQPDHAYKIKTTKPWDKDRGFEAIINLGDVPQDHKSQPGLRFSWGDKFSLVLRGQGAGARPILEQRNKGKWEQVRILRECPPLDEQFWKSHHVLKVHRLGARMIVEFDGKGYWHQDTIIEKEQKKPTSTSWPRAPLRLSLFGVDCLLAVHRLTGQSTEKDAKGKIRPIQLSFERNAPSPGQPSLGGSISFKATGEQTTIESSGTRTKLRGDLLDRVTVEGVWQGTVAKYRVTLVCTDLEAPLLSAFAAYFPPAPDASAPDDIEFRPAISVLEVDSGDPEELPDAQASFNLSRAALDLLVPDWQTALLPYRPITIRARYPESTDWTILFRGYITPESASRTGWNDYELPIIARGPLVRLMKPAALIDERFTPLDLLIQDNRQSLYGAEAAKYLLEKELGSSWVQNFNGKDDGNPLRYTPRAQLPLLSSRGPGFFEVTQTPSSGNWRLPPPFGEDLKTWIDAIAKFDFAVWFYDPKDNGFFYGRITEFLVERSKTIWHVSEDKPSSSNTTATYPLLTSLTKSGLLENAYNDVRVWSAPPEEGAGLFPALLMGRAGAAPDPNDPLSEAQSWRRTDLLKPSIIKLSTVNQAYTQSLAENTWRGFEGRTPIRLDAEFGTGFLGPRWGEILNLTRGFEGPYGPELPKGEEWRILRVKHKFDFSGSSTDRFSTTINTRSINNHGL